VLLRYYPDLTAGDGGVALTLERQGCCAKWPGCFVCSEKCQDEMYVHVGNVDLQPGDTTAASRNYIGRTIQPIRGGGFTPTLNLHDPSDLVKPSAVVEGPCCYGGWLGVCSDTIYQVSASKGKAGEFGTITKPRPNCTCRDCCLAFCSHIDDYSFANGPAFDSLSPEKKATLLASFIHLDFLFFENDLPPIMVRQNNGNGCIICTLCQVYVCGCCLPVVRCLLCWMWGLRLIAHCPTCSKFVSRLAASNNVCLYLCWH
jgi:hypothetical protein